jgi:hypothetical protein
MAKRVYQIINSKMNRLMSSFMKPSVSAIGLILLAGLALLAGACDPFATGSVGASVTGSVVTTTGTGLDEAQFALFQNGSVVRSVSVNERGRYSIDGLDPGTYTAYYLAPGYPDSTFEVSVQDIQRLGTDTLRGPARLGGRVIDAVTGDPVGGVTVRFDIRSDTRAESEQANPLRGNVGLQKAGKNFEADFETQTDRDGTYEIAGVPRGTATQRVVTGSDYFRSQKVGIRIQEGQNAISPAGLSPEMDGEEALRIVVSWGETPTDLDAHLTGPGGDGDRFHVAYFRQDPSGVGASLSSDAKDGFGPEAITIERYQDGLYRYSIHNFSDPSRDGATGIAGSAEVTVYGSDGQIAFYSAPPAGPGDGNTWRVLEAVVTGDDVTMSDNAGQTLGYFQAGSPQDVTTFRGAASDFTDTGSKSKPILPRPMREDMNPPLRARSN